MPDFLHTIPINNNSHAGRRALSSVLRSQAGRSRGFWRSSFRASARWVAMLPLFCHPGIQNGVTLRARTLNFRPSIFSVNRSKLLRHIQPAKTVYKKIHCICQIICISCPCRLKDRREGHQFAPTSWGLSSFKKD